MHNVGADRIAYDLNGEKTRANNPILKYPSWYSVAMYGLVAIILYNAKQTSAMAVDSYGVHDSQLPAETKQTTERRRARATP